MAVSTEPSVLIADDHVPTRAMVRRVIEQDGFRVLSEVDDADGAIHAARENLPDVAILDVRMPGNGLRACEVIRLEHPEICIVILTISEDMVDVLVALAAGASAYWLKGDDPTSIPRVVRRALAGELIIAGMLLKTLIMGQGGQDLRRRLVNHLYQDARFTQKEYEVMELLSESLSTAEIGRRLFIADVTVRTHIAHIVQKLNATDRDDVRRMIGKVSWTSYFDTDG
jgi:two-component system, NarL family, nitrate/nitrite response regulator NarL